MSNEHEKPKMTPDEFQRLIKTRDELESKLPSKFERENFAQERHVKEKMDSLKTIDTSIKDARAERIARADPQRQRETAQRQRETVSIQDWAPSARRMRSSLESPGSKSSSPTIAKSTAPKGKSSLFSR